MKHLQSRILLLALTFICSANSFAQVDTSLLSAKLEQVKSQLGKNIVFALYKDGKIEYKKESGDFNMKIQQPINASSQWLTAALVMTFVQEGKISLDDKVSDYLPIFSKYYKSYITIRHCLTHYTGIQSEGVTRLTSSRRYSSLEEEVNDFASKKDIQTNAGTEFRYSNIGLNIAARVLEVVTKRTFDRLMQERITRPLGMRATTFASDNYDLAFNPSGGARSTPADMVNFLSMLLQKGKFKDKQILSEESVAMMHELQASAIPAKNAPKTTEGWSYGLGTWIMETSAKGSASIVTVPSLAGTWPVLDLCRGYAFILFTKELSSEPARNVYMNIKNIIDDALPANHCK
ncbi:serine hydrolase domain-containing protein [Aridibaculum aurantiacum]|uniref:serine hydrolase domain-containing protein n=1 Tax=Aridibaculum aurantiacum TaxID=2810307 RepID=UPI001A9688F7|nr:serine hydrolase [Aridibaculum aurantiacum]